ncbi:glycoside hydrolase family 44 protein [Armatimonas sp.]|uniref:glycoside hydrolase family 44 protein n=1 Tax=Armatimonas sp. TaxID=1872638 RepID=UPI00286A4AC7|nr:glycoside hydrolase family 44 protein [Armatimonas sp.]
MSRQQAQLTIALSPTGAAISPLIYGVNNEHDPARLKLLGATVNRLGGTPWSALNGPIRATNSGNDYYFHNYDSIGGIPNDPAGFHQRTSGVGGTTMLTMPLLDKVAKDTKSYAYSVRKYGQQKDVLEGDAGNGVKPDGSLIATNDPADAYTANTPALQETWLRSLPGSIPLFGLDNEPMLWHNSHRAAHPEGARMQEVIAATKTYATKVRSVLPNAAILGPEEWNYEGCFTSGYDAKRAKSLSYNPASYPDRKANGGQDWIPVYVRALKEHTDQTGQRLIDYLSVHFYPHNATGQTLLEDKSDTPAIQALRLRATRSLWDPSYVSEDYIKDFGPPNNTIRLIPRLKQWAAVFPGTKTALTEYSFGPDNLLVSALAQVEALGIFGREGLDLACRWPSPNPSSPVGLAFRLFRNYDEKGGQFGTLVQSTSLSGSSADTLSAFAALDEKRTALTLILVNKSLTQSLSLKIDTLQGDTAFRSTLFVRSPFTLAAMAYRLEGAGTSAAQLTRLPDPAVVQNTSLSLSLPAQSATLLIVYPKARRIPKNS